MRAYDPVNGTLYTGAVDDEYFAMLWQVSYQTGFTIREVWRMVRVAQFGEAAFDDKWRPEEELRQLKFQTNCDAELLEQGELSIGELWEIRQRAIDGLRLLVGLGLASAEIEKILEKSEAETKRIQEKVAHMMRKRLQ